MKLIYGPKGFGKTKIIRDDVNDIAKKAKGNVVFITDKPVSSVDIDFSVRCISVDEYKIETEEAFEGFVKGLMAGNRDIEYLFIDGIARITNAALGDLEGFFTALDNLAESTGVNVEMTVSSTKEDLPKFLLKYIG